MRKICSKQRKCGDYYIPDLTVPDTKKYIIGKCATVLFYTVIFAMILFPDMSIAVKNGMLAFLVLILILAAVGYLIKLIDPKDGKIYEKKSNKL